MNDIDFAKMDGLVPAVIQDYDTRQVLMLGYMNAAAYEQTLQTGRVTFYSRSKQRLWTKGETSGNYLNVVSIGSDCDGDALLVKVKPVGAVCHTGTDTCWGEENKADPLLFLHQLQDVIERRKAQMPEGSYTTELFRSGINRIAQKVGEETVEMIIEATNGSDERMIYEGSDMLYHAMVLLSEKGFRIEDLVNELIERHEPTWKKH
ncbi:MAG: bifunctional phosphoribosyl-AMP cyclohydrolase/phosphoribosyl-ATP diphosphatase HisIE [Prevotellaceae bacterium]|jgi:phosphoribosyl-ATP pyrophosphohydrolase/phosphoribosyl-AMP cyclohydrolase|nr:bifunctional phosphoribosyl-AMP cyclohydrolase/phosphoribosyl-ATP diphosphatase HisIE [Prevotellaceae bacterium]